MRFKLKKQRIKNASGVVVLSGDPLMDFSPDGPLRIAIRAYDPLGRMDLLSDKSSPFGDYIVEQLFQELAVESAVYLFGPQTKSPYKLLFEVVDAYGEF